MKFRHVDAAKWDFPVAHARKVLHLNPSGYFSQKKRPASMRQSEDLVMLALVGSAFEAMLKMYGCFV